MTKTEISACKSLWVWSLCTCDFLLEQINLNVNQSGACILVSLVCQALPFNCDVFLRLQCEPDKVRDVICSLLEPQPLKECLQYNRCSRNSCWKKEVIHRGPRNIWRKHLNLGLSRRILYRWALHLGTRTSQCYGHWGKSVFLLMRARKAPFMSVLRRL